MNAINYLKLLLFASTAMTQAAQAQTAAGNAPGAAPQAESPTVEADIVVTAQRREERLLDVPAAVPSSAGDGVPGALGGDGGAPKAAVSQGAGGRMQCACMRAMVAFSASVASPSTICSAAVNSSIL